MPIVHAYRRSASVPVEFGGRTYQFEPDELGRIVCDVPEGPALHRLVVEIPEAYVLLAPARPLPVEQPAEPEAELPAEPEAEAPSPFLIAFTDDEGHEHRLDLRKLDRAGLDQFCLDNGITKSPANAKDDTVRQKIVDHLAGV